MADRIPRTKVQLLRTLSLRCDLSQIQVARVLAELARLACAGAPRPHGFSVPGLGKVRISRHAARTGWNVHTGRTIRIPAKTVPRFDFSKAASAAIAAAAAALPAPPPKPAPARPAPTRAKARAKPAEKPAGKGTSR